MAKNEKTSIDVASIAAKGLKKPGSLTKKEIKTLAASALTQAADKPKAAPAKPAAKPAAKPKPAAAPAAKPLEKTAAAKAAPKKPAAKAAPKKAK